LVTTRILTRRRLIAAAPPRRRRSSRPLWADIAASPAARRLQLSTFARVYAAAGVVLLLAIAYLVVAAQATQSSYDLARLKEQNAQLRAEQDQLRYTMAAEHTPARVGQEAAAAGLLRSNQLKYVNYQPVVLDLSAPLGPSQPAQGPLWQQAVAAVFGGARDVLAAGS
jgi:Tfp pilus assembly protein PilN